MFDLTKKVALVVGGAGYLGAEVSEELAKQGACVVIGDVDLGRSEKTAADICALDSNAKAKGMFLDITSEECVAEAINHIGDEYGQLNILVNLAYTSSKGRLEDLTGEQFDKTLHINVTAGFILAREATRIMPDGGSIVMFSSMYGRVAPDPRVYVEPMTPNPIDYGAAKAGVEQMVRYLAVHYGGRGIRVNAVSPGPLPNPGSEQHRQDAVFPDFTARLVNKVPLARIGVPKEVAAAVVFLASDEAAYVTGHTLSVDGGWTAW